MEGFTEGFSFRRLHRLLLQLQSHGADGGARMHWQLVAGLDVLDIARLRSANPFGLVVRKNSRDLVAK